MMRAVKQMKGFNIFLAIVLSLLLVLTGGPLSAFAAVGDDIQGPTSLVDSGTLDERAKTIPDEWVENTLPDSWFETEPPAYEVAAEEGYKGDVLPEIGLDQGAAEAVNDSSAGINNAVTLPTVGTTAANINTEIVSDPGNYGTVANNVYGELEGTLPENEIPEYEWIYIPGSDDDYEIIFQFSLSGLVTSSETDLALAGAVVSLVYEGLVMVSVQTDSEGRYYIPEMFFYDEELGEWYITVSFDGYQTIYELLGEWLDEYIDFDYYDYYEVINLGNVTIDFYLEAEEAAWDGVLVISGVVTSYEYNNPLEDVVVEFVSSVGTFAALTNEEGIYEILIHPEGEEGLGISAVLLGSELTASLRGFLSNTVNVDSYIAYIDEYGRLAIDIDLKPAMYVPEGHALAFGTVTLEGELVDGASVYFQLHDEIDAIPEGMYYVIEEDGIIFSTKTDAYGGFSILLPAFNATAYTAWAVYEPENGDANNDVRINLDTEVAAELSIIPGFGVDIPQRAVSPHIELLLNEGDIVELDFELYWVSIQPLQIVEIHNAGHLAAFLTGSGPGDNISQFILMDNINMAGMGTFQGRGFDALGRPFMGSFSSLDGNNFIISNLDLVPRPETEPANTPGRNDIGFIRVLGHGAIIENVTFANITYSDRSSLATWNTAVGNIGLVAGRVAPNSIVTISNVTIQGPGVGSNTNMTVAGARPFSNKRMGGLIGFVDANSTLNIENPDVRVSINLQTTGTSGGNRVISSAGGLVGAVQGSVNINGGSVHLTTITTGGSPNASGSERIFQHTGGAIGRILTGSGATMVESLTVTGAIVAQTVGGVVGSNANATLNSLVIDRTTTSITATDATIVAGGFVGDAHTATIINSASNSTLSIGTGTAGGFIGRGLSPVVNSINLENVENRANITGNTTAGGFVGSGMAIRIVDALNIGTISSSGHLGGFIGTATGVVIIEDSENNPAVDTNNGLSQGATTVNTATGGFIGSMNAGNATLHNVVNHSNITITMRGRIGGLIGRTQGAGAINITDSRNYGNIMNNWTATTASARDTQSSAGGLIGQAEGTLNVISSSNHGIVRNNGRAGVGGIVGITPTRAGSTTTLTNVQNHGHIIAFSRHRQGGGLVGHSRNPITINDSTNYGQVTMNATGGASLNINTVGGFIGHANNVVTINNGVNRGDIRVHGTSGVGGGTIRAGGFIGTTLNRVTIDRAINYGNVWTENRQVRGAGHNMGGIIGRMQWPSASANRTATLNNVTNHGNIGYNGTVAAPAGAAGGIVGNSHHRTGARGLNITNALNTGNVRGLAVAGGIVGWNNSLRTTIDGAMNLGNITTSATDGSSGGIIGRAARNDLTVIHTGNEGVVRTGGIGTGNSTSTTFAGAGGIVGNIDRGTRNRIMNSFNAGSIEGAARAAGGIVGGIRRSGTTLIQDVYNIGSVHSRRTADTAGNGILGLRRNAVGNVTLDRVFNAGNVSGDPIFRGTGGTGSPGVGANLMSRRVISNNVFFDTSVHSGRGIEDVAGRQGAGTSSLTSGGWAAFNNSPAWLQNSWMDDMIAENFDAWESYPYLAWQTNSTIEDGFFTLRTGTTLQERFFIEVQPGADHLITVANRTANFLGVFDFTGAYVAGEVLRPAVRSFIPYGARDNSQAQHVERSTGNHLNVPVTRGINQRMSVGLISPQGVVGFNGNEMFTGVVIVGVDYYNRNNVVTWSRIYRNSTFTNPDNGFLNVDAEDLQLGDVFRVTALGYHPAYYTVSQATFDAIQTDPVGRHLVRIPMTRAAIPYLRVEVRNSTAEADIPPLIALARNPGAQRSRDGGAFAELPSAGVVSTFNANGSYWYDVLRGTGDLFRTNSIDLTFSQIRNPNIIATADNPHIVWILLECIIDPPVNLHLVRMVEDESMEDGVRELRLPHGGRGAGGNVHANPFVGPRFTLEFRLPEYPVIPGGPAMSLPTTGTTDSAWAVQNATRYTEVRAIPIPGLAIPGNGGNLTFRPSAWTPLGDIAEWDDGDVATLSHYTLELEHEYHARVEVVETIQIVEGFDHIHRIHIPHAVVTLEADMGLEYPELITLPQEGWHLASGAVASGGVFDPVRVLDGERLEATATGFIGSAIEYVVVPDADAESETIFLELERDRIGRIYGFTLQAAMLEDAENLLVVPNARIYIINNATGMLVAQSTSNSQGFFEYTGLPAGSYTVFATHTSWNSAISIPTPVVLTIDANDTVSNARVNVFMDQSRGEYFPIFVRVMTSTGVNLTNQATATLTYGGATSPHSSSYVEPFQVLWMHRDSAAWVNTGEIEVSVQDFVSEFIRVSDRMSHPITIPFLFIDVELTQIIEDLRVYVVQDPDIPRSLPLLISSATLKHEGVYVSPMYDPPTGQFFIPWAEVGEELVGWAPGFNSVTHILAPEDAITQLVIINLSETMLISPFEVRVVDIYGVPITTASLITPYTSANDTGIFILDNVLRVGDTVTATAPGLADASIIISYGDANAGFATIILAERLPFDLRITNVAGNASPLTHSNQSATADGTVLTIDTAANSVLFNAQINMTAGEVAENHDFLGWYRGTTAPAHGTHVSTLSNLVTTYEHEFTMPAVDVHYFALWGARGIVGAPATQIVFHFYGAREIVIGPGPGYVRESRPIIPKYASIAVPVAFGEPLDQDLLEKVWEQVEYYGGVSFAFWGWFRNEELNASGRQLHNHRRPIVGTEGITIPTSFTQAEFEALANEEGILNLYTIWALWGDANDDDVVNIADIIVIQDNVFQFPNAPAINLAAARVTHGVNVTIADVTLVQDYVFRFPGAVLPGPRP